MTCPLCGRRKGRRRCPAVAALICSTCCGTKRRVAIACPDDCVYLDGAHAGAWQGRITQRERDQRRVAPHLAALSESQQELFILALVGLREIARQSRELDDRVCAEALGTLRKTVETRTHGLIYEHRAEDPRAQALTARLAEAFGRPDGAGRTSAPADADLLVVLKALAAVLTASTGDPSQPRSFLELVQRLTGGMTVARSQEPRIVLA